MWCVWLLREKNVRDNNMQDELFFMSLSYRKNLISSLHYKTGYLVPQLSKLFVLTSSAVSQLVFAQLFHRFFFLIYFFTQLRYQTWIKTHENWHSGRGEYENPISQLFEFETKKWNLKFWRRKNSNFIDFLSLKISFIFDKIWTAW